MLFASEGARVVCADINKSAVEKTVARIHEHTGLNDIAIAVGADVGREDDIKALVDATVDKFGESADIQLCQQTANAFEQAAWMSCSTTLASCTPRMIMHSTLKSLSGMLGRLLISAAIALTPNVPFTIVISLQGILQ